MSRNKVYYDIFETDTHYEYHCNSEKKLVQNRSSMSRMIIKESPEAGRFLMRCINEAKNLGLIHCPTFN